MKQCVFVGYSNSLKGFKCLDPAEGRIYISRDVVFNEHVYPFASLNPNAGARLRAELSLLPDVLLNPSTQFGDAVVHDRHVDTLVATDYGSGAAISSTEKNSGEKGAGCGENIAVSERYFMCHGRGGNANPQGDLPGNAARSDSPSTLSSARSPSSSGTGNLALSPAGSSAQDSGSPPSEVTRAAAHPDLLEGGSND